MKNPGGKKDDECPKENLETIETSEGRYKASEACSFYISFWK